MNNHIPQHTKLNAPWTKEDEFTRSFEREERGEVFPGESFEVQRYPSNRFRPVETSFHPPHNFSVDGFYNLVRIQPPQEASHNSVCLPSRLSCRCCTRDQVPVYEGIRREETRCINGDYYFEVAPALVRPGFWVKKCLHMWHPSCFFAWLLDDDSEWWDKRLRVCAGCAEVKWYVRKTMGWGVWELSEVMDWKS
ncbi:hypothetical protein M011DRAFT_44054 [Sporormia fimetaria CBS 119925]|uniref:Uncharacterized protein n=1 Tax=Sporormia fimetaria CBS 119925 TaxID=1340428 RepID=A0A6A6VBE7_9PLEO|nr:hypothetical protein M011DRAFT_44054 [Sporormia fimetaria CBS 119925]